MEHVRNQLAERIAVVEKEEFDALALDVFRYQAAHNPIYARYLDLLRIRPAAVRRATEIPHLPISLFKTHALRTGDWQPTRTFTSSGTTGATTSRHALRDEDWYRRNARRAFERQYGSLSDYTVLALLPAYLERTGSSLVFMADDFIHQSADPRSGFFLDDFERLAGLLETLREEGRRVLFLGVSFGLLDFGEQYPRALANAVVMETGGMKGRRRELTRAELHGQLSAAFGQAHIHSEYGMTELLSQAYAPRDGRFLPAPTMRVATRQLTDPLAPAAAHQIGVLNITDLANLDTISFIATDDLGRVDAEGGFEVLGRMDHSDVRGCNLLVSEAGSGG